MEEKFKKIYLYVSIATGVAAILFLISFIINIINSGTIWSIQAIANGISTLAWTYVFVCNLKRYLKSKKSK